MRNRAEPTNFRRVRNRSESSRTVSFLKQRINLRPRYRSTCKHCFFRFEFRNLEIYKFKYRCCSCIVLETHNFEARAPVSRQYLASISPVSHQYLASISPVSRRYLTIISLLSHNYLTIISLFSHNYLAIISQLSRNYLIEARALLCPGLAERLRATAGLTSPGVHIYISISTSTSISISISIYLSISLYVYIYI